MFEAFDVSDFQVDVVLSYQFLGAENEEDGAV